jgi:hypothetical protein
MISLKGGFFDPLTGTQNRDTARMSYRMSHIYQDSDSSFWNFRTRTPSDVLRILDNDRALLVFDTCMGNPGFQVNPRIGAEVKFSLRTRDAAVAEIRKNQAKAELGRLWAAKRSGPTRLDFMQIMGLARLVHELYVESFQQEPGERANWIAHKALNRAVTEGRLVDVPPIIPGQMPNERQLATEEFGSDFTAGINALPVLPDGDQGLERRYGPLCDWVLTQKCLRVDYATRKRLLHAIAKAGDTGPRRLKENAAGIYGADEYLGTYPQYQSRRTWTQVFEQWRAETRPAPSTVSNWKGHLTSLQTFVGHDDVGRLTKQDIVSWKDKLVQDGLSGRTINDGYLACIKRLLTYEVDNHRLTENVAGKVSVSTRGQAGQTQLPYATEEVAQLLKLARQETSKPLRWLPWLAALSGSRIGEVAQLWGSSVRRDGDTWVMSIRAAPDGGRLKNQWSERDTPIHQAIIDEGFLDFVAERGTGPLFYQRTSGDHNKKHPRVSAIELQRGYERSPASKTRERRPTMPSDIGSKPSWARSMFPTVFPTRSWGTENDQRPTRTVTTPFTRRRRW